MIENISINWPVLMNTFLAPYQHIYAQGPQFSAENFAKFRGSVSKFCDSPQENHPNFAA